MKRVIQYLIIISILFSLSACTTKRISFEQSIINLKSYEDSLTLVAQKYNESLIETFDLNIEGSKLIKNLVLKMKNGDEIQIRIINTAVDYNDTSGGPEEISINYNIVKNSESEFNIPLFVEIVNTISGRKITEKYCNDFLKAPEKRFSPSRYGIYKSDNELIFKYEFLNWLEEWSIGYHFYKDYSAELTFWGFSKQSTN